MMKIGFIGLGIMGKPMAKNLLEAGYPVTVYNRSKPPVEELAALGAGTAASPKEVAQASGVIFTMVPDSCHVRQMALGENGVIEGAGSGSVLIDCSSINPYVSQEIAAKLAEKGIDMLDAPVSGGEPGAIAGTLSFMVGGDAGVLERVRPILEVLGDSILLCGGNGAGCITKLTNQIVVASSLVVLSEAMVFAKKCGVEPAIAFEAIRGGLAGSTLMEAKVPMMLDGNFKPGGKLDYQVKDAKNVLETGHAAGAPLPVTSMVMEMLQWLGQNGYSQDDHSTIVHYYENLAKTDVRRSPGHSQSDCE